MRVIKICVECYIDSQILIKEGDIIIITDIAQCEINKNNCGVEK